MEITNGMKVRIINTLMTGKVTEIGCDKCTVQIDNKKWECEKSELSKPIGELFWAIILAAKESIEKITYRFFEDKSGNGNLKVIVGFLIGTLITFGIAYLKNR